MKNKDDRPEQAAELRRQAERIAQEKTAQSSGGPEALLPEETRPTHHELQVHQIELEMRNEELRRVQQELEVSKARYFDLYELAPVGYLTLSEKGLILEANLTTATLLGVERSALVNESLSRLIFPEDQDIYYRHCQQLVEADAQQTCELRMRKKDGSPLWVRMEVTAAQDPDGAHRFRVVMSDITEGKKIAELLKSQFEHSPDIILIIDRDYKIEVINRSATGNFTVENLKGMDSIAILPPEHQDFARQAVTRCFETGKIQEFEHCIDDEKWVRARVVPMAEDLTISRVMIISTDITEHRKAEEALRESEEKYRNILENIEEGYYEVDLAGNFTFVNDSMIRQLQYSREELIGMNFRTYTPREEVEGAYKTFNRAYLTGEIFKWYPVTNIRKDGTPIFLEDSISCRRDREGRIIGFRGISRDITERKKAEEALRESEKRYRALTDLLPLSIFEVDTALSLTSFNQTAREVFRYNEEDYKEGMNALQFFSPEEWERVGKNMGKVIQGTSIPGQEFIFFRKDGSTFIGLIYSSPIIHQNKIVGIRGAIVDITNRKRAEEEKRSLEEQLQRAEKMEALGILAGGVAHDLNNVLGIVVGYAELLLMEEDKSSPIRPSLAHILDGGQRAAAMVQDLLTLARRGVSGRAILNLNKIIADCQESPEFEKLYSYHPSIKIKADLDPDLLNISCSSVHLEKTLFNLVSNASEAMPKGGTLTIKTANQYLDRPIQGYDDFQEGDYVVVSVSDTGEGIHAVDLKRIFEPFYTKKVMGRSGTGLGLAVVWGTVKDHQGYINVQSEAGKGSTFTLYFPVTREDITANEVAVSISEYLGKGEAILIVDDVPGQRDLATTMLKKLNYSVTSVESGEEAVAYLKAHTVDLMVLDMIMDPGMDGLDTYQSILDIHPRQKAIIVSGFSETERVTAAQALGAGAYVKKPYIIEKLGLAVRKELDRAP